jgi:hypothetical protein
VGFVKLSSAATLVATLLLASGCSGDDDPAADPAPAGRPPDLATSDVVCPAVDAATVTWTDFHAVGEAAPRLRADLSIVPLGRRDYCVAADASDSIDLAEAIVSYTVELDDRDNYGERYETFDREGSEELLNFPFGFQVYGPCRDVTAEIVLRVRGTEHTYRAETQAGPKCADG